MFEKLRVFPENDVICRGKLGLPTATAANSLRRRNNWRCVSQCDFIAIWKLTEITKSPTHQFCQHNPTDCSLLCWWNQTDLKSTDNKVSQMCIHLSLSWQNIHIEEKKEVVDAKLEICKLSSSQVCQVVSSRILRINWILQALNLKGPTPSFHYLPKAI